MRRPADSCTLQRQTRDQQQEIKRRLATLSPEEYEVMQRMVAGKLNKVIANELLISLRTVETRRHKVLEKMKADSLAELVWSSHFRSPEVASGLIEVYQAAVAALMDRG